MSETVIKVQNLSKQYRIGKREGYKTFRETLVDAAKAPFVRLSGALSKGLGAKSLEQGAESHSSNSLPLALSSKQSLRSDDLIWALKDLSFEVKQGEVLGIIGRNGAGKSTLLKILSKITEPTEGRVELRGRVGSLLEVGTGFHPELTGHENIYLYGAILGMDRWEVTRKFDEIVAFAELDKFIDTPVKKYSSGMYMRLAFAVAAHLEPEILLVDEVLAVGDAQFQKKCLGKMGDVSKQGRTVLFVSHNMAAIVALCSRALLIENGNLQQDGLSRDVTAAYQARCIPVSSYSADLQGLPRKGTGKGRFSSFSLRPMGESGLPLPAAQTGCDLYIDTIIQTTSDIVDANVAVIIYDSVGYRLIDINTAQKRNFLTLSSGKRALVEFRIRDVLLKPGLFFIGLWLGRGNVEEIDNIEYVARLEIAQNAEATKHTEAFPGPYLCRFDTSIVPISEERP